MYDNIGFYLNADEVDSKNILEEILSNGNDIDVEKYGKTGNGVDFAYISLKGRNEQKLTFKVLPYQISLLGKNSSICKYFLGNNFETLTLKQFNDAISEISERLGIDISKAVVCRIDVATNFLMEYSPSSYLSSLTYLSRHIRGSINENLYFKTTERELNFYDKKKEYRQKGVKIPDEFKAIDNVLRYEIRFKKNVAKTFKQKVTISDLCSESFFLKVFGLWQKFYWNITKQNPIIFCQSATLSTAEFRDYYFVKGIEATGGIDYVYSTIDESKKAGTISSSKACYFRKIVNKAYETTSTFSEHDFIVELDKKMKLFKPPIK